MELELIEAFIPETLILMHPTCYIPEWFAKEGDEDLATMPLTQGFSRLSFSVETVILLSMHNQNEAAKILRDAAQAYKVDVDAIAAKIKQEFAGQGEVENRDEADQELTIQAANESSKESSRSIGTVSFTLSRWAHSRAPHFSVRLPALSRCSPERGRLLRPPRSASPGSKPEVPTRLVELGLDQLMQLGGLE